MCSKIRRSCLLVCEEKFLSTFHNFFVFKAMSSLTVETWRSESARQSVVPRRATPETRRWATPRDPPSVRHPPSGARPLSVGHPSGCPSALLTHRVLSLRRAIPSGHSVTTYGSYHPFSRKFIHWPQNASTFKKINHMFKNFILCREISSSVQKVHLLRSKFILCLPNSSTMPFF
jgi:hypothetical protein